MGLGQPSRLPPPPPPPPKSGPVCNAFHYKAIRHILPYDPMFDRQTWWASQMSVIIRSEVLFRGQVVLHTELFGDNPKHRPYPRDFNFTPDMLHHMTKDLDTLVPTFRARCANACHYTAMEDDGSNGTRLQLAYFMFTVCSIP